MRQQLLLTAILATLSLHSSAFGTLLTSPAERAQLDSRRQNSELHPLPVQRVKVVELNKTISLEGLVTRQKGPATIWLNGQLLDKATTGLSIYSHAQRAIAVSLPSPQGNVLLKPGQLIRPDNGELHDAYQQQSWPLDDKQAAPLDAESVSKNPPQTLDIH
jgi:hypothetical protein